PSTSTKWSVNGMSELAAGDAGLGDDRRNLGKVHRRHDMRAGDAGDFGEPVQHLDADLASFAPRVGGFLEARNMRVRDDRAEELLTHPARRACRGNRRDADEDRQVDAGVPYARHVAL